MSVDRTQRPCPRCGKPTFLLLPIHGERGGLELCIPCGVEVRRDASDREREQKEFLDDFLNGRMFGKKTTAGPGEISRELLTEALKLTHPDRHGPNLNALATRVSAELTALRVHAKPKAKPAPVSGDVRSRPVGPRPVCKKPKYPCDMCRRLVPYYYCDKCRARWDANRQAERDRENQKRRRRRQWRRTGLTCEVCESHFTPGRVDARYCSPACRQRAYRQRSKVVA